MRLPLDHVHLLLLVFQSEPKPSITLKISKGEVQSPSKMLQKRFKKEKGSELRKLKCKLKSEEEVKTEIKEELNEEAKNENGLETKTSSAIVEKNEITNSPVSVDSEGKRSDEEAKNQDEDSNKLVSVEKIHLLQETNDGIEEELNGEKKNDTTETQDVINKCNDGGSKSKDDAIEMKSNETVEKVKEPDKIDENEGDDNKNIETNNEQDEMEKTTETKDSITDKIDKDTLNKKDNAEDESEEKLEEVTVKHELAVSISKESVAVTNENEMAVSISKESVEVTNENELAVSISKKTVAVTNENEMAVSISKESVAVTNENELAVSISKKSVEVTNENEMAVSISKESQESQSDSQGEQKTEGKDSEEENGKDEVDGGNDLKQDNGDESDSIVKIGDVKKENSVETGNENASDSLSSEEVKSEKENIVEKTTEDNGEVSTAANGTNQSENGKCAISALDSIDRIGEEKAATEDDSASNTDNSETVKVNQSVDVTTMNEDKTAEEKPCVSSTDGGSMSLGAKEKDADSDRKEETDQMEETTKEQPKSLVADYSDSDDESLNNQNIESESCMVDEEIKTQELEASKPSDENAAVKKPKKRKQEEMSKESCSSSSEDDVTNDKDSHQDRTIKKAVRRSDPQAAISEIQEQCESDDVHKSESQSAPPDDEVGCKRKISEEDVKLLKENKEETKQVETKEPELYQQDSKITDTSEKKADEEPDKKEDSLTEKNAKERDTCDGMLEKEKVVEHEITSKPKGDKETDTVNEASDNENEDAQVDDKVETSDTEEEVVKSATVMKGVLSDTDSEESKPLKKVKGLLAHSRQTMKRQVGCTCTSYISYWTCLFIFYLFCLVIFPFVFQLH